MQRMRPNIDKLYVYDSGCQFPHMMVKGFNDYEYMKGGIIHNSGMIPVYPYAQDVEIDGITKTLLMATFSADKKKVARFFKLSKASIESNTTHLETFKASGTKPVELSISFE